MSKILAAVFGALYMGGALFAYSASYEAQICYWGPEKAGRASSVALAVAWPVAVVFVGTIVTLTGRPGIYACGAKQKADAP